MSTISAAVQRLASQWVSCVPALATHELRKMADKIQARAIRRCGELLKKIERGAGRPKGNGSGAEPISKSGAARAAGISRRQKQTALRVARIPEPEFEAAVDSDDPPTVTELAERGKLRACSTALMQHHAGPRSSAAAGLGSRRKWQFPAGRAEHRRAPVTPAAASTRTMNAA